MATRQKQMRSQPLDSRKPGSTKSSDLRRRNAPFIEMKLELQSRSSSANDTRRLPGGGLSGRLNSYKKGRPVKQAFEENSNAFEQDGIMFVNTDPVDAMEPKQTSNVVITAAEILDRTGEKDYKSVYDINLRCSKLNSLPNLEKFSSLRVLDMSANRISRISCLECCGELRELKLYDNRIEAIEKIDSLGELQSLQIQHNRICTLGRGLVNARKLTCLRLDHNLLKKLELKELAAMSKLTQLDISNNKLDDISALNCLPNLAELTARNNRLRTLELTRCKKIEDIDISGNRISEMNCLINHNSSLKSLNVSKNNISRIDMPSGLRLLEELDLSRNTIRKLAKLPILFPNIQILDISHNHISSAEELTYLGQCKVLRELIYRNNPLAELEPSDDVPMTPRTPRDQLNQFNLPTIIPNLQVVDGFVLKKMAAGAAPLMRPMSASTLISSRQVQSHLDSLEADLKSMQALLEESFRTVRMSVDRLPLEPPETTRLYRPVSRSSRRSRIMEARMFAENHFDYKET